MTDSSKQEPNLLPAISAGSKAYHHFFEGILEGMGEHSIAHALGKFSISTAVGIASVDTLHAYQQDGLHTGVSMTHW